MVERDDWRRLECGEDGIERCDLSPVGFSGDGGFGVYRGDRSLELIWAEVPAAELLRYASALRSITGGAATFTRAYLRHDPAAPNIARALLAS